MMGEAKAFGRSWWCRGGGAAIMLLLTAVGVLRSPRDTLFWIAVSFFVAHTGLAVRRYLADRRTRTTAEVIRHHTTHAPTVNRRGGMIFTPAPANSLLVPIKITIKDLPQQTKNAL